MRGDGRQDYYPGSPVDELPRNEVQPGSSDSVGELQQIERGGGVTIQTRIKLADGEVTIQPNHGEKQKKKKGRVDQAEPKASQRGEGSNSPRVLRPSSAERKKANGLGNPDPLAQLTVMTHPQPDRRTKGRERVTRVSRRGNAKRKTPRGKALRLLGDGMCGAALACVIHTGMVTTVDGMSAGDQFISLIPRSATA